MPCLQRFKIEQENLEREAQRTADRQRELEARVEQLAPRPGARERSLIAEAKETLGAARSRDGVARPAPAGWRPTSSRRRWPPTTRRRPRSRAPKRAGRTHHRRPPRRARAARASSAQRASARSRSPSSSASSWRSKRSSREIVGRAPDASKLKAAAEARPAADGRDRRDRGADHRCRGGSAGRGRRCQGQERAAAASARWKPASSEPRSRRSPSCLKPAGDSGLPPVLDQIKVEAGLRDGAGRRARRRSRRAGRARRAGALGTQCRSRGRSRPCRAASSRCQPASQARPNSPAGLSKSASCARQTAAGCSGNFKPGQRLVSVEGDLWRWDGFVAAAQGRHRGRQPPAGAQPAGRACRRQEVQRAALPRTARGRSRCRRRALPCGPGRRAAPAPALARDAGRLGADPRRLTGHGTAGARNRDRLPAVAEAKSAHAGSSARGAKPSLPRPKPRCEHAAAAWRPGSRACRRRRSSRSSSPRVSESQDRADFARA